MDEKRLIKKMFAKEYEGCRLYAAQVMSFLARVFYRDAEGARRIAVYGKYGNHAKESQTTVNTEFGPVIVTYEGDKAKALFGWLSDWERPGQVREHIYRNTSRW